MQTWIVILGLFSIAATAGLTWILMRVNQGPTRRSGGDVGPMAADTGGRRDDADSGGDGDGGGD